MIRDAHKILRSCFEQAVKWGLIEKNPAIYATVPKYKANKREIWTAETLMYATEVCEDEILKLAMNLSFSASLRIGELCGLIWASVPLWAEGEESLHAEASDTSMRHCIHHPAFQTNLCDIHRSVELSPECLRQTE